MKDPYAEMNMACEGLGVIEYRRFQAEMEAHKRCESDGADCPPIPKPPLSAPPPCMDQESCLSRELEAMVRALDLWAQDHPRAPHGWWDRSRTRGPLSRLQYRLLQLPDYQSATDWLSHLSAGDFDKQVCPDDETDCQIRRAKLHAVLVGINDTLHDGVYGGRQLPLRCKLELAASFDPKVIDALIEYLAFDEVRRPAMVALQQLGGLSTQNAHRITQLLWRPDALAHIEPLMSGVKDVLPHLEETGLDTRPVSRELGLAVVDCLEDPTCPGHPQAIELISLAESREAVQGLLKYLANLDYESGGKVEAISKIAHTFLHEEAGRSSTDLHLKLGQLMAKEEAQPSCPLIREIKRQWLDLPEDNPRRRKGDTLHDEIWRRAESCGPPVN